MLLRSRRWQYYQSVFFRSWKSASKRRRRRRKLSSSSLVMSLKAVVVVVVSENPDSTVNVSGPRRFSVCVPHSWIGIVSVRQKELGSRLPSSPPPTHLLRQTAPLRAQHLLLFPDTIIGNAFTSRVSENKFGQNSSIFFFISYLIYYAFFVIFFSFCFK